MPYQPHPPQTPARAVLRVALGALTAVGVVAAAGVVLPGRSATDARNDLRSDLTVVTALSAGADHLDPLPDGVSLDDPTDTASLYRRAGLDRRVVTRWARAALARAGGAGPLTTAAATAPAGTPSTSGLGAHVAPSCSGTGADGKRVQPMYVREATTPSRYAEVLPLLLNELANVDDVFAVSAARTGGVRRVRWVHESCTPILLEVVVPAGALASFGATINALRAQGYADPSRKYLAFADATALCGVGTLYPDSSPTDNLNDTRPSYARVDSPCWTGRTSIAAHELTHNLGGVLPGAPHRTANGHCWDEADLLCYDDGSGTPMQTFCTDKRQDQLLDCGNDDYFSTAPVPGTWLAQSWNTASSGFLDSTAPDPTIAPSPQSATTSAPTAGPRPRTRRTKITGQWRGGWGRPGLVTGRLRLPGRGADVMGEQLVLQRRSRSAVWEAVGRDTTDRSGRVAVRERPERGAVYRWVYDGDDELRPSRSRRIHARR